MSQLNFTPHAVVPFVIDPKREAKVRDRLPAPKVCRYCNGRVVFVNNSHVYGSTVGLWPFVYTCVNCDSFVGTHTGTDIPLGTLANRELRQLRQVAKQSFLALNKLLHRNATQSYKWLAEQMDKPVNETHFGWFEAEDLNKALQITEAVRIQLSEEANV